LQLPDFYLFTFVFYLLHEYCRLSENWTKKEIIQFNQRTQITINAILKNPNLFPSSAKNRDIRKAIVDKNNSFYYKIDSYHQKIHLLTFFDCRQDPKKLNLL
jgi:hypothetical protein